MRLFISYSHADLSFVKRLTSDLHRLGFDVWLDERELRIGDSIAGALRRAIDSCGFFVIIVSATSNSSKWVQRELDVAISAEMKGTIRGILPILRHTAELPSLLEGRLYADFRGRAYKQPFKHLLAALDYDLAKFGVLASFISKERRLARLVPHLKTHFGLRPIDLWEPMSVHVEITGGYLRYLRDKNCEQQPDASRRFSASSPPSPLPLDRERQCLRNEDVQIGFGHVRNDYLFDSDTIGGVYVPSWKNIIHIAGPSLVVRDVLRHLSACDLLGDDVRDDLSEMLNWWKFPRVPHQNSVVVSGSRFLKHFEPERD